MQFPLYAVPAIVAFVAKAAIFVYACYSKIRSLQTRLCLLFVFCMMVQSIAEIDLFAARSSGSSAVQEMVGRWWYGATILGIAVLLHLSLVTGVNRSDARFSVFSVAIIYVPAAILEMLLWKTTSLVAGFQPVGYTIAKIPGPYYFLVEFQSVVYLLAAVCLFAYGARQRLSRIEQLRNRLLLLGFLPFGLLVVGALILLHLGYHCVNGTVGLVALMFFLATATYALYQYRLVDVCYYLPGSKIRKQKVDFYQRIRSLSGELADSHSANDLLNRIADLMQCEVALVGGPSTLVAVPYADESIIEDYTPSEFPREQLEKIHGIVSADEVAECNPTLHQLMKRYRVGAVVPFNVPGLPMQWLLLGEHIQNHVYSSQDFKIVEALFDRLSKCFVNNISLLRSYVNEVEADVVRYGKQLATVREEVRVFEQKLDEIDLASRTLRDENAMRRRTALRVFQSNDPDVVLSGSQTLEQYLADRERQIIVAALRLSSNKSEAAALLGITETVLDVLVDRYGLRRETAE